MKRRVELGRNFAPSVERARLAPGSPKALALRATIEAISSAPELPMHCDARVIVPPVREAWVRRVRRENLWLHFEIREDCVLFTLVVTHPPIPAYDDDDDDD